MRHPKVRREGTRNNFVFLCGLKLCIIFGGFKNLSGSPIIFDGFILEDSIERSKWFEVELFAECGPNLFK